ncbi:MAG: cytochrome c oxidase assembly protein [Hyphomicrobium sp.]|nr:cytochrome c oxidase assembly protein [Hyphomicrobium sp.]
MLRFDKTDHVRVVFVGIGIALVALSAATTLAQSISGLVSAGPVTTHMLMHLALMNVAGPFAGLCVIQIVKRSWSAGELALAGVAQILLLWAWHSPAAFDWAHHSSLTMAAMHVSLYLTAILFWAAVFGAERDARWMSIATVLVTGKLFCLLAVLLALSPRVLYLLSSHHASAVALADQQFAGLIMIVACPLTYVLAGVVIASRWLLEIESRSTGSATLLHSE